MFFVLLIFWIFFPVWIGGIQWIIATISGLIAKNTGILENLATFKDAIKTNKVKQIVALLGSVLCLGLGTQQVAMYFLSGAYFWLVLFSFGGYLLLFIIPWFNLILLFKQRVTTVGSAFFYLSTGLLLVAIVALAKTKNVIYTTESGSYPVPTNGTVKVITIVLLVVYYLFCLSLLIVVESENETKKIKRLSYRGSPILHKSLALFRNAFANEPFKSLEKRNATKLSLILAFLPIIFVFVMFLVVKVFHSKFYMAELTLFCGISPILIGGISLLFLKNTPNILKGLSLVLYTLLGLLNLFWTYYFQGVFIRLATEGYLYDKMTNSINLITAVGTIILTTSAWLMPYLLFLVKRKVAA